MSDVVMNAEFSKDQLEKYRMQNLSGLQAMQKDPKSISGYLSKSILYGKDTPFGELVTENTLKNVSIDLCRDYYKTYYRPNIAYMAVVGDITPEEAMEKIQKYFGLWQSADIPGKQIDIPEAPEKRKVIVYDRPESVQSVIRVTYPVEFKLKSDDYFQARVMNTILGGGVYRLFENLREKHGWTYGSYSSLSQSKYIGNFTAFADVSNAVTDSAVNEILYEMNRLRDEQVPANELNRVKNYMTGNFALSLENPSTIARFAINIERYDLPDDYYRNYLKSIDQVTAGQVMSAANKYLRPEESYVFVVGNKKEIDEKLKELSSENKVHTINITGDIKE
jgi:predicted Zn-dependent peptidase